MKKELQTIESANTATAVLPPLSQTGDKNTQVAHADHVVINHIYQTPPSADAVTAGNSSPVVSDDDTEWIDAYNRKAVAEYEKMRTSPVDKTAKEFYRFYVSCDIKRDVSPKNGNTIFDINAAKLCELSSCTVISAAGGFGKSTMMRHLLLSAIEQYGELGLMPIFVRLADYVYSETADIFEFILEQANCFGAGISRERLISRLENGGCFLMLDGLDEVLPAEVKRLDYKMRPFFAAYDKNCFVVTTRPYPIHKLNALGRFEVMGLQPLRYEQAVELVKKRENFYGNSIKGAKLSAVLTRELFEKHKSLMCNPKLLTVMLKTYGRLNIIPDKLHELYREVVKSLTELYDTESGNTNRMLKTRLSVRAILERFSALCYKAYEKGEHDFTEQTVYRYLRDIDTETDTADLLFDVCENLCFLEVSGGKFHFFHRSMQEYFCAVYLLQTPERLSSFNAVLRTRPQDGKESVLAYLYEMKPEMVEEYVLIPFFAEFFGNSKRHTGYCNYLLSQYPVIYYDHEEPLEESDNQPIAPLLQFILAMLDVRYEYSPNDFPFYEEFAKWITVMPIMSFFDDDDEDGVSVNLMSNAVAVSFSDNQEFTFADKAGEVMPPERIEYSSYDQDTGDTIYEEMGWELEFKPHEVYEVYENEGKYGELVKILDSDEFELKAEYFALFDFYESLKLRYGKKAQGRDNNV